MTIPHLALGMGFLLLAASGASAQGVPERLRGRLAAATAAEITALVAEAEAEGLPGEPLVRKALEGASKGAQDVRIVTAVRLLRERLGAARAALGPAASERALNPAAAALYVGASPALLQQIQERSGRHDPAGAFDALTYLVQRGVPPRDAAPLLDALVNSRAGDTDFAVLQRLVDRDLARGGTAAEAARQRTREILRSKGVPHELPR